MNDKTLLVIGASSEVGIKLIETIGDDYSLIYAHYGHNAEELNKLKERFDDRLIIIEDDLLSEDAGANVIKTIETKGVWPDHMVHLTAPKLENIRIKKAKWADFEKNLNVSLRSAFTISQSVLDHMVKEKKEGRLVFMLSSCTNGIPPRFMTPYVTAKYAMLGFLKSLATEYDSKNITVNGISPGMMETKFLSEMIDFVAEENAQKSPFGRNLYVEEVIPTFKFLLSDDASKITGQNIVVTGGM